MTKKEADKQITQFTKKLREMAGKNPDLFRNSTLYFHRFKSDNLPEGFERDKDVSDSYKVYRYKGDGFEVTIFVDEPLTT